MASVQHLYGRAFRIPYEIISSCNEKEKDLRERFFAALIIQAAWKGYLVRKMIEKWHAAATLIQRIVRGWLIRWHLPDFYKAYILRLQWWHYNKMATRIQALWKGYWIRKTLQIRERLANSKHLEKVNAEMIDKMRAAFAALQAKAEADEDSKKVVLFIFFKIHHLLRTNQQEGILSDHGNMDPSFLERALKSIPMKNYMTQLRANYNVRQKEDEGTQVEFNSKQLQRLYDLYRNRDRSHDVKDVPSEDDKNVQKKPFNLNGKLTRPPYKPDLQSTEKYSSPCYPLDRTIDKTRHISKHDFDLFVRSNKKTAPKWPPYYIDFWKEAKCAAHYLQSWFD